MMNDELQCPYCGEIAIVIDDNPSSLPWSDGEDAEIKCQCCKKDLTVVCEVTKIRHFCVDEYHDEIEYDD